MRKSLHWAASVFVSLIAVALIVWLWGSLDRLMPPNFEIVNDEAEFEQFLADHKNERRNAQFLHDKLVFLPTGFFIQSMEFVSSSNVNITGYVWQKYPMNYPYQKGINFPEEISSGDTVLDERFRREVAYKGEKHELVGWYFDVTVRQSFDYSRYPLDFLTVWLRVWPADFDNSDFILIVPDFESYIETNQARFGLDQDIVSGEWNIEESFFSYRDVPYDTRFGWNVHEQDMNHVDIYSEFYFNMGADRKFVNAFIINLVPLFVVALLLFSALLTVSLDTVQSSRFGFSTSSFLGAASALFFVVLLSHIQVRNEFSGSGLLYIEYFYLVMYAAILLVSVDAYLVSLPSTHEWRWIRWRDNLLPKLLYWPVVLWAMVAASLMVLR